VRSAGVRTSNLMSALKTLSASFAPTAQMMCSSSCAIECIVTRPCLTEGTSRQRACNRQTVLAGNDQIMLRAPIWTRAPCALLTTIGRLSFATVGTNGGKPVSQPKISNKRWLEEQDIDNAADDYRFPTSVFRATWTAA
jgi:hypothetical protein